MPDLQTIKMFKLFWIGALVLNWFKAWDTKKNLQKKEQFTAEGAEDAEK